MAHAQQQTLTSNQQHQQPAQVPANNSNQVTKMEDITSDEYLRTPGEDSPMVSYSPRMGAITVGSQIRLRAAHQIHRKLAPYAGTLATINETPQHPNTWFGVLLSDGKRVKIRKSAFDVLNDHDDVPMLNLNAAATSAPPKLHIDDEEPEPETEYYERDDLSTGANSLNEDEDMEEGETVTGTAADDGEWRPRRRVKATSRLIDTMDPSSNSSTPRRKGKGTKAKNLVGCYVVIESGRFQGETGFVSKGGNGYYCVDLDADHTADGLKEGNSVMKRSSDLREIPAPGQNNREQAIAAGAKRSRASSLGSVEDSDNGEQGYVSDGAGSYDSRSTFSRKRARVAGHTLSPAAAAAAAAAAAEKGESWVGQKVLVKSGKHRGEIGLVLRSGHGFYCVNIRGREIMKRANELALYEAGTPSTKKVKPIPKEEDEKLRYAANILCALMQHQDNSFAFKHAQLEKPGSRGGDLWNLETDEVSDSDMVPTVHEPLEDGGYDASSGEQDTEVHASQEISVPYQTPHVKSPLVSPRRPASPQHMASTPLGASYGYAVPMSAPASRTMAAPMLSSSQYQAMQQQAFNAGQMQLASPQSGLTFNNAVKSAVQALALDNNMRVNLQQFPWAGGQPVMQAYSPHNTSRTPVNQAAYRGFSHQ